MDWPNVSPWLCSAPDCRVLAWDPYSTALENLRDIGEPIDVRLDGPHGQETPVKSADQAQGPAGPSDAGTPTQHDTMHTQSDGPTQEFPHGA